MFGLPGFRLVAGLGIAAQHRPALERAAGADVVGGATIRADASAVKRSCDLLASNGWKRERQQRIVGHGSRETVAGLA